MLQHKRRPPCEKSGLGTGGEPIGTAGNLYEPTVLKDVPNRARAMNEEPFCPIKLMNSFKTEADRLPQGLAVYAYVNSPHDQDLIAKSIESGMVSINHSGLALPETPFGGIKGCPVARGLAAGPISGEFRVGGE
jgi:succinate-semialdehyde dehydrogenase / glutarate-semialdehyde dehydrogenase